MAAIHKNKKKLKTTMNDIKRDSFQKPGSTPTIYMNEHLTPHVPDIQSNALIKKKQEQDKLDRVNAVNTELELVKGYNQTVSDVIDCYKTFVPMNDILVRVFLKEPKTTDSGLWLPTHSKSDIIELKRRAGSGDRYTQNIEITPFTFSTQCVIVNTPEFLQEDPRYKTGNTVTIQHLKSKGDVLGDDSIVIDYQCSFVHPEYGDITPPRDFQNPHFGYALIPVGIIKGYNKVKETDNTDQE